jgi:hypothetical protein
MLPSLIAHGGSDIAVGATLRMLARTPSTRLPHRCRISVPRCHGGAGKQSSVTDGNPFRVDPRMGAMTQIPPGWKVGSYPEGYSGAGEGPWRVEMVSNSSLAESLMSERIVPLTAIPALQIHTQRTAADP